MNKHEIDEFRSAALEFEATGKYCKHDPNTISGKKFWIEQARRSVKGYHIGSDYISGYNYFYLNFSPIKKAKTDGDDTKARVRGSLSFDFPDWWDFDKLYFDYLEEAEAAGEHASVLKSRRKGYEQPNSELVLTPNGYKNIGSLKVGDIIMNPSGNTTKVVDIFPQGEKDVYEITLHDNRKVKCGLNHLWRVYNSKNNLVTVTTKYLLKYNLVQGKNREKNAFTFHIPEIKPLEFEKKDLRIHPYILGCLIGDGGLTTGQVKFSVEDRDISTIERIIYLLGDNYVYKKDWNIKYSIISKTKGLNQLYRDICFYGLNKKSYNKFIPEEYKYSSIEDRWELVRGLMDTDGTSSPNGTVRFTSSSEKLIDDLSFILRSLGIRCAKQKTNLGGNLTYFNNGSASIVRDTWILSIVTDQKLFNLERKQKNIRTNRNYNFNKVGIERIEKLDYKEECTCIMVDNPNHLYITRDCIPTHNSFKGGSMCNRNYFLIPRSTSYVYASDKAYLIGDGGILSKAWDIMSFVDENTPWVKRRQASDTGLQKRSSYKVMENGTYIEKGFKSEIVGITIGGDWNRVRGKQAKLILWEEAGCHAKGTKVIMSDGTFKNVEDICVGDKLMGPDSKCRTVLELHRGKDDMYKITPKNGIEQIVNSKHPIYVEYQDYYKNSPVKMTMTAKDYLNIVKDTPKRKYHYSLTRPEIIEFNKQEVKIDPYLLGLWLGDGDSDTVIFTNIDKEVIDFLKDYAIQNDLECKITTSNKGTCFRIALSSGLRKNNWIRKELKNLGILGNKNIPDKYIYTDKESRLKLLAGLIDTDGSYSKKKKAIQISQHEKRKDIIFKAAYIARSLGMKVSIDTRITTDRKLKDHTIKGGELHYRLTILYGHEDIPCLIPRKKGIDRKGFLRNPLSTRFDITYYGFDDYYGFTLDKDHLFLTEDFTITHNTNPYLLKAYNAALPSLKQGNIVYGLSVSFGCVCAGTKVWTGNGKWVNIEDVKLGDTLLGYNGVSTSIEPITYIQPEGYKECIRIETSKNRYLECSHDHPLLVKSKIINTGKKTTIVTFKKAEELVTGDRIMISNNIGHFGEKEMWQPELIGLLIGDGNYSINESPSLSISSESLYSFLESKDLSINISKIKKSSTGVYAQIYFRGIIDKLKDLGIYGQVKDKKTLPINIEQYDEESIRKLLSGYFEADGNVQVINNRRVVKLTCKYKEILEDVQQLLLKLGINSAIRKEKKGSEVLTSIVNNKKYETKEFFAHVLYITDSFYIKRFKEKIGFLSKEKQSRLDSFVDNFYREANVYPNGVLFRKNPSNNKGEYFTSLDRLYGLEGVKVTKVSNIGIKRIYNLTANNTHTYITNGFVSANTGGSEGQDFMGLEELFFNPKGHEIHPMKNIWEDDELGGYCGFFHPEWANMDGYMDECGNSKKIEAIAAWEKELANIKEHARNPDAVVRFLAEHPIKPSQALLQSKHNEFPVIEIKKTLAKLMSSEQMQDAEFIGEFELDDVSGRYKWKPNPDLTPIKVFPLDLTGDNNAISIDGCWVIYEHPILDENNQVTWGRYIAGTDPVDDDRDDSLESESIQSTFLLDTWTDRIVAEYSGRPYNVETYYENLRRGLLYYNATCNYEQEKKGLYTYFKNKNSLHLLADNLEILSDRGISMFKGEGNRSKGTMGTHPVQKHGRDLIKTYLVNVSPGTEEVLNVHRIRSIPLLKELMYWNPEGNFDRVSALSMLMLYRAEKYRQISERKVLVKSKLENSRILERNKVNSYGNFHKINQLFHKVTN